MIAVLYEGKKEKRRVRLTCNRAAIDQALLDKSALVISIPLTKPTRFDRVTLFENGEAVLKNRFDRVMFIIGNFELTLRVGP